MVTPSTFAVKAKNRKRKLKHQMKWLNANVPHTHTHKRECERKKKRANDECFTSSYYHLIDPPSNRVILCGASKKRHATSCAHSFLSLCPFGFRCCCCCFGWVGWNFSTLWNRLYPPANRIVFCAFNPIFHDLIF